jgi:hypothetical protein
MSIWTWHNLLLCYPLPLNPILKPDERRLPISFFGLVDLDQRNDLRLHPVIANLSCTKAILNPQISIVIKKDASQFLCAVRPDNAESFHVP